jgi:HTH-type transcriptional regulator, glycine betaine synthesis regulator
MSEENTNGTGIEGNPTIREVHDSMLDGLGQLADYFGFSKVMGQLYGTLMLSAEPLCLDDMMERLSISKASVSMNMRTLEHMGMVRQVWVRGRGGRRKFYEAETDFWQIITSLLTGREMRDVERAINVIDENNQLLTKRLQEMTEADQHLAHLYIERMSQMQVLFRFAQLIITSVLAQADTTDFSDISGIDIRT